MLSIDFIRQHPEVVSAGLKRRHDPQNIEELLRLVEQRRGLATRCEGLYVALKGLNEKVRDIPERKREEVQKQIKAVTKDIRLLELQISNIETHMQPLLQALPNVPHSSVRDGGEHQSNRILSTWGDPLRFYFPQKPHWELGERLGLTDFAAGTRLAGSRFVVLKGIGN